MNSGSFFRLDLETSKVVDGITYYNYVDLPELNAGEDNLRYPVRLSVSSDNVSFFVHYFSKNDIPRHIEEVILRLPFGTNDTEALSSSIKRVYNTSFPLSSYLYDVLLDRYTNRNSNYNSIRNCQINKNSYSSLSIWGLIDKSIDNKWVIKLHNKDTNTDITKFLRKLLLDFMFDLVHSDVFETSKYYTQMREGLMNDFFFSSIIKKCEYYYYRRLIKNRYESISECNFENKLLFFNSMKKLYAEKLDKAEGEWIDVIMGSLADKHFSFSPEWYEEQAPNKRKNRTFCVSESWFVDPEEEMARIVFPLPEPDGKTHKIHYLNSFELSNLIGSKDDSSISTRNTKVSKWYYRRFDFKDTFRLHLFNHVNILFSTLLCLFVIVSMLSVLYPYFWKSPIYFAIFPALCFLSLFVSGCYFFYSYRKLNKNCTQSNSSRLDDVLLCIRRKRECKKSFCAAFSFVCFSLFLFFSEENDSIIYHFVAWGILLLAVSLLLGFNFRNRVLDNIHLLLPRLVASITTAWVMIVIGNDIYKEHLSIPVLIILFLIVFVFILYENNKAQPHQNPRTLFLRAFELIGISYSIAVIVGLFAIDIITPSIEVEASTYLKALDKFQWPSLEGRGCKEFSLTIFPQFLIPFSILAMFIGVFIQMISDEKNLTDF